MPWTRFTAFVGLLLFALSFFQNSEAQPLCRVTFARMYVSPSMLEIIRKEVLTDIEVDMESSILTDHETELFMTIAPPALYGDYALVKVWAPETVWPVLYFNVRISEGGNIRVGTIHPALLLQKPAPYLRQISVMQNGLMMARGDSPDFKELRVPENSVFNNVTIDLFTGVPKDKN